MITRNMLLPAWFTERMMSDVWLFGLLLNTGHWLIIESVDNIVQAADGTIWLDVSMWEGTPTLPEGFGKVLTSPTTRNKATVNAAHVVLAVELADT